jgi:hypothetical protein
MSPEQHDGDDSASNAVTANPDYPLGQFAAAVSAAQAHSDAATRQRTWRKAEAWARVVEGMLSGKLRVGSRTPVGVTPAWATLEVIRGGFATGALLAGGDLQPHEQTLIERLGSATLDAPRGALNRHYLTVDGFAGLVQALRSGLYRIGLPEEGALLTVAWLLDHDHVESAETILREIFPFIDQLRFYPAPASRPLTDGVLVHVQTVGDVLQTLKGVKVPRDILAQKEAALVWAPLHDRAVELFLETVDGPIPSAEKQPDGKLVRSESGRFTVVGGWPCQRYPEGWRIRVTALLQDYRLLRTKHRLCGKGERHSENFTILRDYLERCSTDPSQLTGRDVGRIRSVLAHTIRKRGLPSSDQCQALRRSQRRVAGLPTAADLSAVLIDRLSALPPEEGIVAIDDALAPVTVEEARLHDLHPGQPLAERMERRVQRCLEAPVEALVEKRLIPSAEMLAVVLPQITAQIAAADLSDPDLRRLYSAIYRAFRRRRSLLLLNLESQVKISELPWVKAIETVGRETTDAAEPEQARAGGNRVEQQRSSAGMIARLALEQLAMLAITSFPHQILPNKLLQELRALAEKAALPLPLVDELAADIFMGAFTEKFLRAAQDAADLLEGTLYERYYGIPYAQVRQIDDVWSLRPGGRTSAEFYRLCHALAGGASLRASVADNGMIIEQEQILTTHNLATLISGVGLRDSLQPHVADLARHCFAWICRRQQQRIDPWKTRLQMMKNTAYGWRQMVFFLALESDDGVAAFVDWSAEHLAKQSPAFQARFRPALNGLVRAANGLPADDATRPLYPDGARRFLGWSVGSHWLMGR